MLQHYHTGTTLSDKIMAWIEALQLEIGSRGNPLNVNEDFLERGLLATDCWVKTVWEQACFHKFCLDLGYVTCQFPRELDQEIVDIFLASNVKGKDLISLNRCRIARHLPVMYINRGRNTYGSSIPRPTKPREKTVDVEVQQRNTNGQRMSTLGIILAQPL